MSTRKMKNTPHILLLLFILTTITHHASTTTCTCDLTANDCDWNCCCDPDCTPEDQTIFSSCITVNKAHIEEMCVSDNLLFSANGKYQVEGTGGGLLCLYRDNYNARFFYSEVASVESEAKFKELADKYRTSSYSANKTEEAEESGSFKFGNPLFVVMNGTQQPVFLPQPMEFLTNECVDTNPARFLLSQMLGYTECVRMVRDLEKACRVDRSLSALSYFNISKVVPHPSYDVKRQGEDGLIQPTPLCKDERGLVLDPCPTPSYDNSSKTCNNVVLSVNYDITYNKSYQINNDVNDKKNVPQVRITQVNVSLTLTNISGPFYQGSNFVFAAEETSTNETSAPKYLRSGNPGYITGRRVLVADRNNTGAFFTHTANSTVIMSTITTRSDGKCGGKLDVLFGVDLRVGCFVDINSTMTKKECAKLQQDIYAYLHVDDLPGYVGIFGNASTNVTTDWLQILNKRPAPGSDFLEEGQCQNIYTDVTYEFLFADSGFQGNPQRKIVGVHVKYDKARAHSYTKCNGLFCPSSQQERLELVQVVSFVDVSRTPQAELKSAPQIKAKASHDFFYPFST